jgi:hypothetical protein
MSMLVRAGPLVAVVAVLSLSACATPTYNYVAPAKEISAPPLGVISTARVGDVMVEQGRYQELDAIRLRQTVKVGLVGTYTFTAGTYTKKGHTKQGEFFNESGLPDTGRVQAGAITDPFEAILLKPDGTTICGVSVLGGTVCKDNVQVERIKVPNLTADAFQQTLIYSGKVGDKINIGYREFSGNMARPAFNNDVEYDLRESKTIGYKGALLDVVEATNQYIRYIVKQNFNSAQQ